MNLRAVRGMNDILPEEIERWQRLENAFRAMADVYQYQEVRTPIVEPTMLFVRSIGETTDIVEKEMYSFDKHGEGLTLRPEGTAGVVRAFIEHTAYAKRPVSRWFYMGPMFRAERPQKGRYRQFYQAGCEVFGDPGPVVDAEMIDMLVGLFRSLGISSIDVHLNSLGGPGTRTRYRDALVAHLSPKKASLSEDSQRRLETNPLRILDSKNPKDIEACEDAPSILDLLDEADKAHFDALCRHLDQLGTPYQVDTRLVRGLDYYTRTLFEIRGSGGDLGAQNALGGGGRYDNLVRELGGPETPAIGFALGLERILLAMSKTPEDTRAIAFLAPLGERAASSALVLARELRELGVPTEVDGRGTSLKSMLRRANSLSARYCLVLGESEVERGIVQVKDLKERGQEDLPLASAARTIAERLSRPSGAA